MATGDVIQFDQWIVDSARGVHKMGTLASGTSDTFKMAFVDSTTTMTTTISNPTWGAAGGTNFSLNEKSGGEYTSGGVTLANVTVTLTSGQAKIDYDDPAQFAATSTNPTSLYYAVIYNDSYSSKPVCATIELGGPIDATASALTVTPNATNGLALGNQA